MTAAPELNEATKPRADYALDKAGSERLDLLRFPLIVGIVFIHSYDLSLSFSDGRIGLAAGSPVTDFIRNLVSQGLARVSVPLLFLISGYLFFHGVDHFHKVYGHKLQSRVRTLLIPLLFWNLVVLGLYALMQALPMTQVFASGRVQSLASFGPADYLNALTGYKTVPIAYPFWFVRDLIILCVASPLIYYSLKFTRLLPLIALGAIWGLRLWQGSTPAVESVLFFSIGSYLAINRLNPFSLDRVGVAAAILCAGLCTAYALLFAEPYASYLLKAAIPAGVIACLALTGPILSLPRLKAGLLWLSGASFFVFAAHEPLLTLTRKLAFRFLKPGTDLMVMSLYLAIPIAVIAILVLVWVGLKASAPRLLSFVTGGRQTKAT